jgi:ATP-dependent RNA helicase DDX31/DBP7
MIVCPTRELSLQCVDAALKVGKKCPNIVVGALVGGENANHEKARLRKGVTILVGTPGRILYHF